MGLPAGPAGVVLPTNVLFCAFAALAVHLLWLLIKQRVRDLTKRTTLLDLPTVWPHLRSPALHDYGSIGSPERTEVESRLVVAVACGLSLKGIHVGNISELPVVNKLMNSFLQTARPAYTYR